MTDKEKLIKEIEALSDSISFDNRNEEFLNNAQILKVIMQKMMNYANIFNAGAPHWMIPFYVTVLGHLRGSLIDEMSAEYRRALNDISQLFGCGKRKVENEKII